MYQVKISREFWKSGEFLKEIYGKHEYKEILREIKETILTLSETGVLPENYNDHVLEHAPYISFNEYHVREDVLVVYSRKDKRLSFRFVEITNHEKLANYDK